MDFLDPKKKRAHGIRLMIGYCLIGIALVLASILLLFAAFGYGISRSTGEVIQNGLVFVDAHPERARVYLNGQDKGETDARYVLEAGKYSLELKRDGYRKWQRDFVLEGGSIARFVYPFLFPDKLQSKDLRQLTVKPDLVTQSPDRHWIVTHHPDVLANFEITDTSTKDNATSTLAVPATLFGSHAGAQSLEFVEWSTDNKHVLLKYNYVGGYDYLVFDRENPTASVNVSQVFGKTFTKVTLRDKKFDQLYIYDATGGLLQAANLRDKATTVVASRVLEFWPYKDNTMLYATDLEAPAGNVLIKLKDGQDVYTVREVATGGRYLLNMAEFEGNEYVVAGSAADGKVYLYKNPLTALKKSSTKNLVITALLRVDNPEYALFSANARFISVQGGNKFAVYDAETKSQFRYDTELPLAAGQKATWMDGHRLMLTSQDKMVVFDYDGINRQTLVAMDPGFTPMFDRDYNQLFTVGPTVADPIKLGMVITDLNIGRE